MPNIALVQDGAEVARQRYADVYAHFVRACEELSSTRGLTFTLHVFTDDEVRFLLRGISSEEFSCVVFASNALLSNEVCQAVTAHRQDFEEYVRAGGGLLLLHQFRASLEDVLPEDLCPRLVDRQSRGQGQAHADASNDITLCYPNSARLDGLRDGKYSSGLRPLYWKSLERGSMPQLLRPILSAGAAGGPEVLMARTVSGIRERVVVATLPLDWLGQGELLTNAIRYASLGEPRRVLWLPASVGPRADFALRWLYSDGASAVSSMGEPNAMSEADKWLFRQVDVCIVPAGEFDRVRDRAEIRAFVERGGTLVTSAPLPPLAATMVSAVIGPYGQRALSRKLYAELATTSAWISVENAFHLRNIVSALAMLQQKRLDDSSLAVRTDAVAHLAASIERRLQQDEHRQDLSSSLALGEILCHLQPEPRGDASLFRWMDEPNPPDEEDVRLQLRALRSHWLRQPDPEFVPLAIEFLKRQAGLGSARSVAPVARLLDATAVLGHAGLLTADDASFEELADVLARELDHQMSKPDVGWSSVEATADITRGLVTLIQHVHAAEPQERLAAHVAEAATVLRRTLRRFDDRAATTAWLAQLARLVHALTLVDEQFPIGLQRLASVEWPAEGPASVVTSVAEDSLMVALAGQVKELRVKERELQEQRVAAAIGRTVATLGGTIVMAVLFTLLLWTHSPRLTWAWIGNVGVAFSVLTVSAGVYFTFLMRFHLLTAWGDRIRDLLTQLSDVLGKLAKIDRGG